MASKQNPDTRSSAEVADRVIRENVSKKRWVSYIWDTLGKTKEERRFLFKLDAALLTYACLGNSLFFSATQLWLIFTSGFFIKFLDQVNINSAFVSGMSATSFPVLLKALIFEQERGPRPLPESIELHADLLDRRRHRRTSTKQYLIDADTRSRMDTIL